MSMQTTFKSFAQESARIEFLRRGLSFTVIGRRYGFKPNTVCKTFRRHFGTDHRFKPGSQGARILEILHAETGIPPIAHNSSPVEKTHGRIPKK